MIANTDYDFDEEDDQSNPVYQFTWIKNLSWLVKSQISKDHYRTWFCDRCLCHFKFEKSFNKHRVDCENVNKCRAILPEDKDKKIKLKMMKWCCLLRNVLEVMYYSAPIDMLKLINNRYMGADFNPFHFNPESFILYFDINNQYGTSICEYLPYKDFEWIEDFSTLDFLNIPDDSPECFWSWFRVSLRVCSKWITWSSQS